MNFINKPLKWFRNWMGGDETQGFLKFKGENVQYVFNMEHFDSKKLICRQTRTIVEQYRHKETRKIVAIKSINVPYNHISSSSSTSLRDKMAREVNNLISVGEHKNIIDFYGMLFQDNVLFICMEYMHMSLEDFYLKIKKQCELSITNMLFPEELLGAINVAVLDALCFCREKKVMHRDIKPKNILLNWTGEIKLADFGVSRVLDESLASTKPIGGFQYRSPEMLEDDGQKYDVRTDVWRLGITLLECIYGRFPYTRKNGKAIDNPETLKSLIKEINPKDLIQKCLQPQHHGEHVSNFLELCLTKEYENRPKYDTLVKTAFYLKYNGEFSEPKNVAKILEKYNPASNQDELKK